MRATTAKALGVWLAAFALAGAAGAADVGTTTASFLKIGVGARAVGMGEAQAALAEGPDALYWNAAGLAAADRPAVAFTHNEWLEDVRYEYLGFAMPAFGWGSFGLAAGYVGMGALEGRDEEGNPTGDFTASDLVLALGFARQLTPWLAAGVGAEYIESKIEAERASTAAGLAGVKVTTPLQGLSAGASVAHLGGEMKFIAEGDPLPWATRAGVAYRLPFGGERNQVTVAVDGLKYRDTDVYLNSGAEYWFANTVAARAGYKAFYDSDGITGGLGFKYSPTKRLTLSADYAYAAMGTDFGGTHRISVGMKF
jgi:hypothetical protein